MPVQSASYLTPELQAEQTAIDRRRKLAEALQGNAMAVPQQGQMVGRFYVPPSPLEGLVKAFQAYAGTKMGQESDAGTKDIAQRATEGRSAALARAVMSGQGSAGQGPEDASGNLQPEQAAVPANPSAGYQSLISSGDPMLAQLGMHGMTQQMTPKNVVVGRSIMNQNTGQLVGSDPTLHAENEARRVSDLEKQRREQEFRDQQARQAALDREALLKAGKGNEGKIPPGYRQLSNGNLEAIPGGPADLKLQGAFNQDTGAFTSLTADMDRLAAEASALKSHPGLGRATGAMSGVPFVGGAMTVPGTDPANFKARLETLKSQVAFGVLQNMRNNSKTGGALGQVSDKEGQLLMNNLAALDRAQSSKEFEEALGRIVKYTDEAKDRLREAYNLKHGSQTQYQGPERRQGGGSDPLGLR